jgi:hypothetical protein
LVNVLCIDRTSSPELGVVLPNKPGDKLTHPKRPAMTGRKKPTKNAIQNKKDMELRSQEAKASAITSGGANKGQQPRMSQAVGGFNLLAHLVVNKPAAGTGGSSRASVALSPIPLSSSLGESTGSAGGELGSSFGSLGGSLTSG